MIIVERANGSGQIDLNSSSSLYMSYLTSPGFSFHNCKRAIISLVGVILRIKWDEECKSSHHTDAQRLEVKEGVKLSFLLLPSPGFLKGGTFTSAETSVLGARHIPNCLLNISGLCLVTQSCPTL